MKLRSSLLRSVCATAVLSLATIVPAHAQTVEVDPTDPIPETHSAVFETEWDTDGDMESWVPNAHFFLDEGTPVDGIVTGTADGVDPTLSISEVNVPTGLDTIIEFAIRKESEDTSRVDLFWADSAGGFSPARMVGISGSLIQANDEFRIVRITFSGQLDGDLSAIRLDPSADGPGDGKTSSVDYFRVYTSPSLNWNPLQDGGSDGGDGDWNTVNNNWWDGSANIQWPNTGSDHAAFGGDGGVVNIQEEGVSVSQMDFAATEYLLQGGPLFMEDEAHIRVANARAVFDAPLAGNNDITISGGGGTAIFTTPIQHAGSLRLHNHVTATTLDDAFGASTVVLGNGGNVFLAALEGSRTFGNDFEWRGNRLIIDHNDLGFGSTGGVTIDGDFLLAGSEPSDFFLRNSLTVNGRISGTGPAGRSLFFRGDSNVMTLNHADNDFAGDIVWGNSTQLEVVADGGFGDPSNILRFVGGTGGVRLLSAFDSSRAIQIEGDTAAIIDTNGFDSTWSGVIDGADEVNSRLYKDGEGILTLTGSTFLGGGTQVREGVLKVAPSGSLVHSDTWDEEHGVAGGAEFLLSGGTFEIDTASYAIGNGLLPDDEAVMQIDSGTFVQHGGELLVGIDGNGQFEMNGGTATIDELVYGGGDWSRIAKIELNGGTLNTSAISRRDGDAEVTIRLNGATIVARDDQADFLPVGTIGSTQFLVGADGVIFDTPASNIGIAANLNHDSAVGGLDGGVTKLGAGSLFFESAQDYTGPTVVSEGTLGGNASLSGDVSVDDGAGLAVRVNQAGGAAGTDHSLLTVNGALALPQSLVIKILPGEDAFTENSATNMEVVTATGGITGFAPGNVVFDTSTFTGAGTWSASQVGDSIVLNYAENEAGGYPEFSATIGDESMREPGDDADGDGVSNLMEYVLGGDPNEAGRQILPEQTLTETELTIGFNRGAASLSDTSVRVEFSTDLTDWTTIESVRVSGSGTIEVTVPRDSHPKLFARLHADLNP